MDDVRADGCVAEVWCSVSGFKPLHKGDLLWGRGDLFGRVEVSLAEWWDSVARQI